jgi:hypothetical protein
MLSFALSFERSSSISTTPSTSLMMSDQVRGDKHRESTGHSDPDLATCVAAGREILTNT